MPNALYPLLLVFVFLVIVTAVLKTDLLGYVSAVCIIFAFMVVLHHYAALGVMGDALQVQNPYLRYFLFRSAVTVGGVAPLSLLGLAWVFKDRLKPWLFYSSVAAVACSGFWTGYRRTALAKDELDFCSALGRVDVHDSAVVPRQLGDGRDLVLVEDVGGVRPDTAAKSETGVCV